MSEESSPPRIGTSTPPPAESGGHDASDFAVLRKEIIEAAGQKVHLFLFVKVRENWGDDPDRYREMGLEFPRE